MNSNRDKVKTVTMRISFLMKHQVILPDLIEFAQELIPESPAINEESSEYLQGAADALLYLLTALEHKGI